MAHFNLRKFFLLSMLALLPFTKGIAQTQLAPGDILFTGYNSNASTTDAFSFVLLVPITSGTSISFTDNGWLPTNVFRAGEQTITWTSNTALIAGREITISGPSAGAGIAILSGPGTATGSCTGSIPSFATSGDQIIAYQIQTGVTVPIAGIHMNVYSTDLGQCGNTTAAAWDPICITDNANYSRMPTGLSAGVSAMWIGTEGVGASEQDNAKFICTGSLNTVASLRDSIMNQAKWAFNSIAPPDPGVAGASGCAFMTTVLSVELRSFTGTGRDNHIQLQWETANEMNHDYFEIEKSADGIHFSKLDRVMAEGGFSYLAHEYGFKDMKPMKGNNYYRLKIVSKDGGFSYSKVVTVSFDGNTGKTVLISPNPARSEIVVMTQAAGYHYITITDITGRTVLQETMSGSTRTLNTGSLAPGRYIVTLTGTSEKVTEQLVIAH